MAGESSAGVELPEGVQQRGVEVPAAALFTPEGEESQDSYVWVVQSDGDVSTVHRRKVETGAITTTGGTLVKGVEPGERIVTAGVNRLREGQQVRVP